MSVERTSTNELIPNDGEEGGGSLIAWVIFIAAVVGGTIGIPIVVNLFF
ncbi:MAG: hypothetical protein LBN39_09235 [Planctomycetaceae bacterium]|jgi:hypothetical protein|nr:hypothetical protein [Planctomycetaceae bacterium]